MSPEETEAYWWPQGELDLMKQESHKTIDSVRQGTTPIQEARGLEKYLQPYGSCGSKQRVASAVLSEQRLQREQDLLSETFIAQASRQYSSYHGEEAQRRAAGDQKSVMKETHPRSKWPAVLSAPRRVALLRSNAS